MTTNKILTISRQFGSGGREIGQKVAKKLGIPFYDKELIEIAARESGIDKELFENEDIMESKGVHFFATVGYAFGSPLSNIGELSLQDRMFIVQSQVIKDIANDGPCVIVGRCADYVLSENDNCVHAFLHADMEDRSKRAIESYEADPDDIENSIKKIDKRRCNYYDYYTDRKWGLATNYDLCLNTSRLGQKECVDILVELMKEAK